jgi:hypothetical protein
MCKIITEKCKIIKYFGKNVKYVCKQYWIGSIDEGKTTTDSPPLWY